MRSFQTGVGTNPKVSVLIRDKGYTQGECHMTTVVEPVWMCPQAKECQGWGQAPKLRGREQVLP